MASLIVKFERRGVELRGEICSDPQGRSKIVFLAGYRPERPGEFKGSLPGDGETYVAEVVRDTQPTIKYKGALIVRLVRRVRWEARPTGDAVLGARRFLPVCLDSEELGDWAAPAAIREEARLKSQAFVDAERRMSSFRSMGVGSIRKELGEPRSVEMISADRVRLTWPGLGTREVPVNELPFCDYPVTRVIGWKQDGDSLSVQCELDVAGMAVPASLNAANRVGTIHPWLTPAAWLPAPLRTEMAAVIRAAMPSPEAEAEARWADHAAEASRRLPAVCEEIATWRSRRAARVVSSRYTTEEDYTSPDEWFSGRFAVTKTRYYLELGTGSDYPGEPTAAELRREKLAEALKAYAHIFYTSVWPTEDPELNPLGREGWQARYQARLAELQRPVRAQWVHWTAARISELNAVVDEIAAIRTELTASNAWSGDSPEDLPSWRGLLEEQRLVQAAEPLLKELRVLRQLSDSNWENLYQMGTLPQGDPAALREWASKATTLIAKVKAAREHEERAAKDAKIVAAAQATRLQEEQPSQTLPPERPAIQDEAAIKSFADAIVELVGRSTGLVALRTEYDAPYGYGRRQMGLQEAVPGLEKTTPGESFFKKFRARDVNRWLGRAIEILESAPPTDPAPTKPVPQPAPVQSQPLSIESLADGLAALKAKFGK